MNKEYKIKLDLNKKLYNKKMTFNQFDENVNDFYIEVTKNNEVVKDLNKSIVTLVAIKPDNTVEAQFVEVENGLVYADLKPSMCDLVGNYQAKAMIVLEGKIITTDTIIYSVNEDKIISRLNEDIVSDERFTLFTDALARLSDIEISEEQRMINEAERILSEENRKIEEAKRVEAELVRQHEEADRTKYDAIRESNENIRKLNEQTRVLAENTRLENEANRIEQEANRVKAEQLRKDNYNFMTEDEERRRLEANAHKEAETLRVSAENTRVNEEAKRRTIEQVRVSAENTRVSNENTRKANETTRQTNETHRVEAETQRQNRYNSFIVDAEANANNFENYTNTAKVNEEERKANELDRKSQEAKRVSNEVERISNENTRKANEVTRIESEKQRIDAENLRKEKIIEIQSDYDSLKKVIIDENASANLQNQINQTNSQLEHIENTVDRLSLVNYRHLKTSDGDWTNAFNEMYKQSKILGKPMYIPNGEYKLNIELNKWECNICGDGIGKTILKPFNNNKPILKDSNNSSRYTTIENLTLDGVSKTGIGVELLRSSYFVNLKNIKICNFDVGCSISSSWGVNFDNVDFSHNITGMSIDFLKGDYEAINLNSWNNCRFSSNYIGIEFVKFTGHSNKFNTCSIEGNNIGIYFKEGYFGVVEFNNCYIEANEQHINTDIDMTGSSVGITLNNSFIQFNKNNQIILNGSIESLSFNNCELQVIENITSMCLINNLSSFNYLSCTLTGTSNLTNDYFTINKVNSIISDKIIKINNEFINPFKVQNISIVDNRATKSVQRNHCKSNFGVNSDGIDDQYLYQIETIFEKKSTGIGDISTYAKLNNQDDKEVYRVNRNGYFGFRGYTFPCGRSNRPVLSTQEKGFITFDVTLNKPIWWDGSKWVDANGSSV